MSQTADLYNGITLKEWSSPAEPSERGKGYQARRQDSTSVSAGVHKYVPHQQAGELQKAASLSLDAGE